MATTLLRNIDITSKLPWYLCIEAIRYSTPNYTVNDVICPPEENSLILPACWSIYTCNFIKGAEIPYLDECSEIETLASLNYMESSNYVETIPSIVPFCIPVMKYIEPNLMILSPHGSVADPSLLRLTGLESIPFYYEDRLQIINMSASDITQEDLQFIVDTHNKQLPQATSEEQANIFIPKYVLTDWVSTYYRRNYPYPHFDNSWWCKQPIHWTSPPPEDMENSSEWNDWLNTYAKHQETVYETDPETGEQTTTVLWESGEWIQPCVPYCYATEFNQCAIIPPDNEFPYTGEPEDDPTMLYNIDWKESPYTDIDPLS